MKINAIYLTALLAILLCGCNNEIPFNLKENPPKFVMNGLIDVENSSNYLLLSLTGQTKTTNVTDAMVEVHINGQLTETVYAQPVTETNGASNKYLLTSTFKPGDLVRIDATTRDGKYHAWIEETVPTPINPIEKVDTISQTIFKNGYISRLIQYKITFHDRPSEQNFYRLVMEEKIAVLKTTESGKDTTVYSVGYNLINREDVVLTDGQPMTSEESNNGLFETIENKYNVFDDSRFTNTAYTMTVYNYLYNDFYQWGASQENIKHLKRDVTIRILSITKAEYYYLKALNALESDAYDESINEPIRFPSNVNGGIGIVGFSTERAYPTIIITDKDIQQEEM